MVWDRTADYRGEVIIMPYRTREELPESVKDNLPAHAQDIYKEAFNSAIEEYWEEERARRVAWAAVKHGYEKNEQGKWVAKKK